MAVVIVHGFLGKEKDYLHLMKRLAEDGEKEVLAFTYQDHFGKKSIPALAKELSHFVEEADIGKKNSIVGLSMGGVIAAHYLEAHGGKNHFETCVSVCTPYHGSWWANLGSVLLGFKGISQLRRKNAFLDTLCDQMSESSVSYFGVWNPVDLWVVPGSSAHGPFMKDSLPVYSFMHDTTFREQKTLDYVSEKVRR